MGHHTHFRNVDAVVTTAIDLQQPKHAWHACPTLVGAFTLESRARGQWLRDSREFVETIRKHEQFTTSTAKLSSLDTELTGILMRSHQLSLACHKHDCPSTSRDGTSASFSLERLHSVRTQR
jgi:hypothetical protein